MKQINIRVPDPLADDLKTLSRHRGESLNKVAVEALQSAIETWVLAAINQTLETES